MVRNKELIIDILSAIEQRDDRDYQANTLELLGEWNYEQVDYHLDLLVDIELIVAERVSTKPFATWVIDRLTWDGHEYLDCFTLYISDMDSDIDGLGVTF